MHDNQYFTNSGDVKECGKSLKDMGDFDKGSTVAKTPADDTIIGWAKEKLGM